MHAPGTLCNYRQLSLFGSIEEFTFYLGAPNPAWLHRHPGIRLFVSRRQMPRSKFKRSVTRWGLDSGGFTELQKYGRWTIGASEYSDLVNTYHSEVGMLDWVAPQDWMCEPIVISGGVASGQSFAGTRLSVIEHQERTVENFIELSGKCNARVIPVVQGFSIDEYHECIDLYGSAGIDLSHFETVGVGSICRRQGTSEAVDILRTISERGINIHGFGLKREALKNAIQYLRSADSMAWSFNARRNGPATCGKMNSRTGEPIKNCANCYHAAVEWYSKTMSLTRGFNKCCR
jgi:hypothetical protein